MSRSEYSDDLDPWDLIRWRGAVASAIRGKRGQSVLRELAAALDAMPDRQLAAGSLKTEDGAFCALGVLGHARGLDLEALDLEDRAGVARAFNIAEALAAEIMFLNDDSVDDLSWRDVELCGPWRPNERPQWIYQSIVDPHAGERRWSYIRKWVRENIAAPKPEEPA